jgi:hypothetical protein
MVNSQPSQPSRYTIQPAGTFQDLLPFQVLDAIDSDLIIHTPRNSKPDLILQPEDVDKDFEHFSSILIGLKFVVLHTLFNLHILSSLSMRIPRK